MKRLSIHVCLCLSLALTAFGCGGSSGGGGSAGEPVTPETGVRQETFLYRDLQRTLPEVIGEQADSPDEGVIREFVVTRSFLLLPPAALTAPATPVWQNEDDSPLDSTAFLWPGVNSGHTLHIRGRAGLRGNYPFTGEEAVDGWGNPNHELSRPAMFKSRHPSDIGIVHDIALAYADSGNGGMALEYAAYGWWAMAPVPGGGALDTTRKLSAHGGMSFGIEVHPRDMPGSADSPITAMYVGRATGHA